MIILKKKRTRKYIELRTEQLIADYAAKTFIPGRSMWQPVENSMGKNKVQQVKLKSCGMVNGFPDGVVLFENSGIILIEIKAPNGQLSHAQKELHLVFNNLGHVVEVVYSLDDFRKVVKKYNVPTRENKFI